MIEEDPDEDLSSAIAEYRRSAAILIDPPPPEQQQQLKSLQERYERMQRLDGYTAQSRGQRLNGLVADVLRSWGIDAIESARSYGEVDVAFALGGDLFVMEAKWKQDPINSDPIGKLQLYTAAAGVPATVRLTRGRDIEAACGQLAATRS